MAHSHVEKSEFRDEILKFFMKYSVRKLVFQRWNFLLVHKIYTWILNIRILIEFYATVHKLKKKSFGVRLPLHKRCLCTFDTWKNNYVYIEHVTAKLFSLLSFSFAGVVCAKICRWLIHLFVRTKDAWRCTFFVCNFLRHVLDNLFFFIWISNIVYSCVWPCDPNYYTH